MTSLPCSLPGREASNVVFPDLAPAPSVVAAYPLGLSPETAASPDLSYSQPYGHLLPYSYPEPATPGDAYLPSQQLSAGRRGLNPSTRQLSTLRSLKQVKIGFRTKAPNRRNSCNRTLESRKKTSPPCLPAPQIFHPSGVYSRQAPCLPVAMAMASEPGISSPDVQLLPQML
ncbi:homeobox protein DLX-4 [Microtus ochrogaster]|uniref:Homeobox protein DLX-4 n=1 Tax=Microtus ochrogaster TaxID=79684 RepID=A0ABM1U3A0_MICOH|nr:homeobox protein DLX-4 [Microtus ochrogaster]